MLRYCTPRCVLQATAFVFSISSLFAQSTVNVTVPATTDPWTAGVSVPITLTPGSQVQITATGQVQHGGGSSLRGPDGLGSTPHFGGPQNGFSDLTAGFGALIGAFVGPTTTVPPPGGDTSTPLLKQMFIVGSSKLVTVPAGATAFILGVMDSNDWGNNGGSLNVFVSGAELAGCVPTFLSGIGYPPAAGLRVGRQLRSQSGLHLVREHQRVLDHLPVRLFGHRTHRSVFCRCP